MSLPFDLFVYPAVVPLVVAMVVLIATRWLPTEVFERYSAGLAVACGFFTTLFLVNGLDWQPRETWHWLPYLGVLVLLAGSVALAQGVVFWERALLLGMLSLLVAVVLVPTWSTIQPVRLRYVLVLAGLVWLLQTLWLPLPRKLQSRAFPIWCALAAMVGSMILALSESLTFAQMGCALASALGGCAIWGWFAHETAWFRSVYSVVAVLFAGLMFTGWVSSFSGIPWIAYMLPACAPLLLWLCVAGPLSRVQGMGRLGLEGGLVLVPLGLAFFLAWSQAAP